LDKNGKPYLKKIWGYDSSGRLLPVKWEVLSSSPSNAKKGKGKEVRKRGKVE
jgi:hypothetical protein